MNCMKSKIELQNRSILSHHLFWNKLAYIFVQIYFVTEIKTIHMTR